MVSQHLMTVTHLGVAELPGRCYHAGIRKEARSCAEGRRPKSRQCRHRESAAQLIKTVRQQTRRKYSAEDKIRVVLEGLRGDHSVAELCRREGVSANVYYVWLREFMEAGKARFTRLERSARPAHCRTN